MLARDLHQFWGVETPYHKWFPRMCEYGFTENQDYAVTDNFVHNSAGGNNITTQLPPVTNCYTEIELELDTELEKNNLAISNDIALFGGKC